MHIAIPLGILLGIALYFGGAVFLRFLARNGILWAFVPANKFTILISDENDEGGGAVVDVLHAVPGHRLDKSSSYDPMKWEFVGEEERDRGFLFRKLGIQWKGIFPKLRKNEIKRFRYGRDTEEELKKEPKEESKYKVRPKNELTKYVHFSGDEHVTVENAETAGNLPLDFMFNFIFERTRPVCSILRVSDSNAYLTTMTMEVVNQIAGAKPPQAYLGGDDSAKEKKDLSDAILNGFKAADGNLIPGIKQAALEELGITITEVNLYQVRADKKTTEYLEKAEQARRDKEVAIIKATGQKEARMLLNDAEADYVDRVIKEIARTPGGAQIRFAEAYEKNEHVTTFAPGGNLGLIVDPTKSEGPKKPEVGFKPDKKEGADEKKAK